MPGERLARAHHLPWSPERPLLHDPVMYAEREGTLTIFVGHSERKRWWRKLRVGAEVEVRLRGRRCGTG